MESRRYSVVIVGGGASGLAAAVELKMSSPELGVLVIEKLAEPARKLRATGSGRCNITNTKAAGYNRIMEFFAKIGLVTRSYENGLVYPYSESAADVAELLISRAASLGVDISCGEEAVSIEKVSDRFIIKSESRDKSGAHTVSTEADYVILATGGKAGPTYGSTGDGYRFARAFGHSMVTPVPILTSVECREWDEGVSPRAICLAGTRSTGIVNLFRKDSDGQMVPLFEEKGEIQFTKYGLSGICIFNMTRHMRFDRAKGESLDDFEIRLNLFPEAKIDEYINGRKKGTFSECSTDELLCTLLKAPLAGYIMSLASSAGINTAGPVSSLTDGDIGMLSALVHELAFHPTGIRGWKDAQATSGGVSLAEIDDGTAESKLVSGLYITGELADRDFQCGGFNLSNAWLTGLAAADSIAAIRKP